MRCFAFHNNLLGTVYLFSQRRLIQTYHPHNNGHPVLRRKPPAPFSRPNGNQERAAPLTAAQGAHRGVTVFIYEPPTTEKGKSLLIHIHLLFFSF
ncbi:hypothetical protein CEXT_685041 [Caerostris extrusa]|uniref:Uncharacterized protein n=1 Tax=Caerostris extrusa TaxID=172846 RepID=A0AAV4V0S1_CAEEX|nr:hypothetical protein CEXT_685041 [Caerostris extrusa]